jgi:hypothetical protein
VKKSSQLYLGMFLCAFSAEKQKYKQTIKLPPVIIRKKNYAKICLYKVLNYSTLSFKKDPKFSMYKFCKLPIVVITK